MTSIKIPAGSQRKKQAPLKFSQAIRQISSGVGILGVLLTVLTSFSLPGIITTAINGDFALNEAGTASIIHNIRLTAPLTIGLVIIFFAVIKEWFNEVVGLYLFSTAVLVTTSMLFSQAGRDLVSYAWRESSGNVIFSFPTNLIKGYFQLYFWAPFVGAILTAIFLTWALLKLNKVKKWDQ
jgi:hypothetical protein